VPVVVDAGAPVVVAAIDAGAADPVKPRGPPPTAAELAIVASLQKLAQQEKWDSIWEARARVRTEVKSPLAREQALGLVINAICARNDNSQLLGLVGQYKEVASGSQLRAMRQRCIKLYPGAESLAW